MELRQAHHPDVRPEPRVDRRRGQRGGEVERPPNRSPTWAMPRGLRDRRVRGTAFPGLAPVDGAWLLGCRRLAWRIAFRRCRIRRRVAYGRQRIVTRARRVGLHDVSPLVAPRAGADDNARRAGRSRPQLHVGPDRPGTWVTGMGLTGEAVDGSPGPCCGSSSRPCAACLPLRWSPRPRRSPEPSRSPTACSSAWLRCAGPACPRRPGDRPDIRTGLSA